MLKQGLKTFWINLIYLFVAMGIFYLFLLLTIFGLVNSISANIGQTINEMSQVINSSLQSSATSINDFLAYSFNQINWNGSLMDAVRQMLDSSWLLNTIKGFLATLNASTEGFDESLKTIATTFSNKLILDVSLASAFLVVGICAANYATRFAIRRRSAKRNVKKFILANTVVPLVQAIVVVIFFIMLSISKIYGFLVNILLLILLEFLALLASWIIHNDGTIKLKKILTFKNVLNHFLINGLIVLIDIIICLVLLFINIFLAILVMIPLVIYSLNIIGVQSDVYVCSLIEKAKVK